MLAHIRRPKLTPGEMSKIGPTDHLEKKITALSPCASINDETIMLWATTFKPYIQETAVDYTGIESVHFGSADMAQSKKFFGDWGLTKVAASAKLLREASCCRASSSFRSVASRKFCSIKKLNSVLSFVAGNW